VINEPSQTAFYRIASDNHSLNSQDGLSNKLDSHFRGKGFRVSKIESGGAFSKSLTEYIGILTGFLVMMALLTAVVGSIGMAGTLSMNIMERTREIGIMRAIGAGNKSILKLVLVEGLLIGMISYLFGSVLSFPISTVLAELISQAIFSAHADFSFTIWGFAVWLGVVLLLSTVSSLLPAKNATRLTIREVLAYE
jgi:putative ABC transport system permease protein